MTDDKTELSNSTQSHTTPPNPDSSSLRQYWLFFSGQLFSLFGSSVVQFAIIWWLTVTSAERYPGQTGLILSIASVAGFAPFVLTSLFAGVLVDRWNRKLVIGFADFIQAFVTVILLIAFYLDMATIPVVLIILAVRAVAQGFHNPATNAIIPLMVPKEKFTKVNSYQYLFNSAINLIGPVIGAVLVEFVGVENLSTILLLDIVSFLVAVIPLVLIHIPDITLQKRQDPNKLGFKAEFKEGISFITNAKGLLPLLITFTVANVLIAPALLLLPLVAINVDLLAGGAATLGILLATSQGGSIISSFIMTRMTLIKRNPRGVFLGQFFAYIGLVILALGAISGDLLIASIGMFVNGFSLPIANVHSQNIWLAVVPNELQGRVMSVRQTIAWILIPIAQFTGGSLSDILGLIPIYLGGAAIGLMFLVYAWVFTSFPRVEAILGIEQTTSQLDQKLLKTDSSQAIPGKNSDDLEVKVETSSE